MNIDGEQTDVRFAVHDGSAYYRPEKLHAEMAVFKTEVGSLGLSCIHVIHTDTEVARYVSQTSVEEYARSTDRAFFASLRAKTIVKQELNTSFLPSPYAHTYSHYMIVLTPGSINVTTF